MKTQVQQTSLNVYNLIIADGTAETQRFRIFEFIKDHKATRREISRALHIETSSVAARVNELMKNKQIKVIGTRPCKVTGIKAQVLGVYWE